MMEAISDWYNDVMAKTDPRAEGWFLSSSPFPPVIIVVSYIIFVTKIGPRLIENRPPFELKSVMLIYNAAQVVLSAVLVYEGAMSGWLTSYNYTCQPIDYSNNPEALRMVRGVWIYYMAKYTELLDTIFFVLRKKNNQVSGLHVFHHSIMTLMMWIAIKFIPGGHFSFFGWVNSFVHIVMYSYYLLAAMGPRMQPYLWWKKYLTILQIVQFIIVILHTVQVLFNGCDMPQAAMNTILFFAIIFLVLFAKFFIAAYYKNKSKKV